MGRKLHHTFEYVTHEDRSPMWVRHAACCGLSLLVGSVRCLYFLWVNTATLSMDRAMAWVESLDIFEDVVGGYIISSAITLKLYLFTLAAA